MSDKRAHDPSAWLDPTKALEKASTPVISIPMRDLREWPANLPIPTHTLRG